MSRSLTLVPALHTPLLCPETLSSVSSLALDFWTPAQTCTQADLPCVPTLHPSCRLTNAQMSIVFTAIIMLGTPTITLAGCIPVKFLVTTRSTRLQVSYNKSRSPVQCFRDPVLFLNCPCRRAQGGTREAIAAYRTGRFAAS